MDAQTERLIAMFGYRRKEYDRIEHIDHERGCTWVEILPKPKPPRKTRQKPWVRKST